jgi:hypothetical protein
MKTTHYNHFSIANSKRLMTPSSTIIRRIKPNNISTAAPSQNFQLKKHKSAMHYANSSHILTIPAESQRSTRKPGNNRHANTRQIKV